MISDYIFHWVLFKVSDFHLVFENPVREYFTVLLERFLKLTLVETSITSHYPDKAMLFMVVQSIMCSSLINPCLSMDISKAKHLSFQMLIKYTLVFLSVNGFPQNFEIISPCDGNRQCKILCYSKCNNPAQSCFIPKPFIEADIDDIDTIPGTSCPCSLYGPPVSNPICNKK
ncbi:hypothetical protein BC833DRAFT_158748 [Globomyces pollinis-pini]|nr:hypothetical protein BC833DRAFT_158748 [Globomyces pollinis-pini]